MVQNIEIGEGGGSPRVVSGRNQSMPIILPCAFIFVAGYVFSVWFLNLYQWGDQEHYARFWHAMIWTNPSEWGRLQLEYLSSTEPLYRLIIAIGTHANIDRIVYLSVWNAAFFAFIGYALIKNRSSVLFFVLVFTNYYVLVLLGPAERLKFAYLFLLIAFCLKDTKWKIAFSVASIFSHTQAAVQFLSAAIYYISINYQKIVSRKRNVVALMIGAPVVVGYSIYYLLVSSGDVLARKAEYYGDESQGIFEIIQWVLVLICGTLVFDRKVQFFLAMLPMGLLTSLYGGRINVATLAFFCALALSQNKTSHPVVLAVMAYMSFKSIGFIMNVLQTGQGFSG